jgi:general nucleoside transport system permease protein
VSVRADVPRPHYARGKIVTARRLAILGMGLAPVALWLTLPPLTLDTVAAPLILGAVSALLGVAAITRGERRAGWGAVASGVLAIGAGVFAVQASSSNLKEVITWSTLISLGLAAATPLIFAAIGGMFSERSGVVNIGLEGMMLMGAFFGIWGADVTGSWYGGLLIGMASGGLLALVHAYFSIHLRADQIIVGTAIIFLAYGITGYLYNDIYRSAGGTPPVLPEIPLVNLDFLASIPPEGLGDFLDKSFGDLSLMTWMAFAVVVLSSIFMFRTTWGLRVRSVGEHPRAADTVGIDVYRVRYACVVFSGVLAAMGGAYLSIGYSHSFTEQMTSGRGFIALAALIFGNWRPYGALAACLLFGLSTAFAPQLQNVEAWAPYGQLFAVLPYLLTIVVVAGVIGRSIPPAAVGRPYVKQ